MIIYNKQNTHTNTYVHAAHAEQKTKQWTPYGIWLFYSVIFNIPNASTNKREILITARDRDRETLYNFSHQIHENIVECIESLSLAPEIIDSKNKYAAVFTLYINLSFFRQ